MNKIELLHIACKIRAHEKRLRELHEEIRKKNKKGVKNDSNKRVKLYREQFFLMHEKSLLLERFWE